MIQISIVFISEQKIDMTVPVMMTHGEKVLKQN